MSNELEKVWLKTKGVICPDSTIYQINKKEPIEGFNLIEVPNKQLPELNNLVQFTTFICVYLLL